LDKKIRVLLVSIFLFNVINFNMVYGVSYEVKPYDVLPTSCNETTGATIICNVTYLYDINDGEVVLINESNTKPAFSYECNFTDLDRNYDGIELNIYYQYTGNNAHNVTFEVYDWTLGRFKRIAYFANNAPIFYWLNISINMWNRDALMNNGTVYTRIIHNSSGNPQHIFEIDYYKITYYKVLIGANIEAGTIILFLIPIISVILMIIMFRK